jgi:uncharacterized membrane protein YphA (DoxX/SURF4 family)
MKGFKHVPAFDSETAQAEERSRLTSDKNPPIPPLPRAVFPRRAQAKRQRHVMLKVIKSTSMTFLHQRRWLWLAVGLAGAVPAAALAHEAYVVEHDYFWQEFNQPYSIHAADALRNPHNLVIALAVTAGIIALLMANFLFRLTKPGRSFHAFFERFARFGPMFIRGAIAAALFFSATSHSFLGPELPLDQFGSPELIKWSLLLISLMLAIGLLTEVAAALGLALFIIAGRVFGAYVLTYANYLGELIALLLFGMRRWSIDAPLLGALGNLRTRYEKYESTIVRVFYGFALIYAGITVKFLHPELTAKVATDWNLAQFHWLFPSDPLLITLGAGLSEIAIGLFIIFGFEMRLTVLISLFYVTLSLFYFRELIWPHYLLYGISLNLLVQPETFTLDHLLFAHHRRRHRWWLRPLLPHHSRGKSAGVRLRPDTSSRSLSA